MSKIYIPLPSKKNIDLYMQQGFDGFIIGIKGFSSKFNYLVDIEELQDILFKLKDYNKDIYIALNRLYYNDEIDKVRELVEYLSKLDITGIGYTDNGLLNILNECNFNKEIMWLSNHLGTNSMTINFLSKRKVSKALLSTEISIKEIIDIKKNSKIPVGVELYGFLNMATSSRKLLSNYFDYINKEKNKNIYSMSNKNKDGKYQVVEDFNTNFFSDKVLNGIIFYPELIRNNIDFIFLDNYLIDEINFYNVIEAFSSLRNAYNDEEFVSKLEKVVESNTFNDTFYGFLNKETVVKVKDYE